MPRRAPRAGGACPAWFPAWFPATMRPDGFMKDIVSRKPSK